MSDNKSKCCTYYQKEAASYDLRRFSCNCRKYYDDLFKKVIDGYLKDAETVLDAGTGTGRFAIYLAKQGKKVVAFDQSAEMLEVARKKSIEEGVEDRIKFVQGDIENLPFKESEFDAIVSIHVLVHFSSIDKILVEFARVLRPKGDLVFDVSESRTAKFYHFVRNQVLNIPFSFRDYFHSLATVKSELSKRTMVVEEVNRVKKFPRFLVHLFLCTLNSKIFIRVMDVIERANYGAVTLLKCKKQS
jgi:ubiquinone/menaquinone biosynthesis C-methylase UbiE